MENLVAPTAYRFALLGGTSPLGADLEAFAHLRGHLPTVFSRRPKKNQLSYAEFDPTQFDAVLNLIGGHKLSLSEDSKDAIHKLDSHLLASSSAISIPFFHLSTGAVFGPLDAPATNETRYGNSGELSTYASLKVNLEKMHSAERVRGTKVSDLRLFSFAGPTFLEKATYFLSMALRSSKMKAPLRLNGPEFLRDFVGPAEVFSAMEGILLSGEHGAFNLFSSDPASRAAIVSSLEEEFGLVFLPSDDEVVEPIVYCSYENQSIRGYCPRSSIESILSAFRQALSR